MRTQQSQSFFWLVVNGFPVFWYFIPSATGSSGAICPLLRLPRTEYCTPRVLWAHLFTHFLHQLVILTFHEIEQNPWRTSAVPIILNTVPWKMGEQSDEIDQSLRSKWSPCSLRSRSWFGPLLVPSRAIQRRILAEYWPWRIMPAWNDSSALSRSFVPPVVPLPGLQACQTKILGFSPNTRNNIFVRLRVEYWFEGGFHHALQVDQFLSLCVRASLCF